jgi:hypothetical protein
MEFWQNKTVKNNLQAKIYDLPAKPMKIPAKNGFYQRKIENTGENVIIE